MPAKAAEPRSTAPTAPATATVAAATRVPAQGQPDREQHGGLQQLDRDDGDDLGAEQARAGRAVWPPGA